MQIIVVGCGKVGRNIVTQLIKENNNVTVIDTNADLIHHISTNYDVMGIIGNGSSFNVLRQADLKRLSHHCPCAEPALFGGKPFPAKGPESFHDHQSGTGSCQGNDAAP